MAWPGPHCEWFPTSCLFQPTPSPAGDPQDIIVKETDGSNKKKVNPVLNHECMGGSFTALCLTIFLVSTW